MSIWDNETCRCSLLMQLQYCSSMLLAAPLKIQAALGEATVLGPRSAAASAMLFVVRAAGSPPPLRPHDHVNAQDSGAQAAALRSDAADEAARRKARARGGDQAASRRGRALGARPSSARPYRPRRCSVVTRLHGCACRSTCRRLLGIGQGMHIEAGARGRRVHSRTGQQGAQGGRCRDGGAHAPALAAACVQQGATV